jgi:acyl dehydratase
MTTIIHANLIHDDHHLNSRKDAAMALDRFLEDLAPGDAWASGSVTIDADAIKAFAGDYDRQPFHLDEVAAEASFFRGLAASGWHVAALSMRLLTEGDVPFAWGIVGAGGEISWPRPTRPGDTLTVVTEIVEVTPSRSRPDRGIVTVRNETRNQHGEAVQVLVARLVVPSRRSAA